MSLERRVVDCLQRDFRVNIMAIEAVKAKYQLLFRAKNT